MTVELTVSVNGELHAALVDSRTTLADFLRRELGLTGTHLGCEHGVCGSCTVLVDGASARSCLMLAAQANGTEITTIEGLAVDGELNHLQEAMRDGHGVPVRLLHARLHDDGHRAAAGEPAPLRDGGARRRSPATSVAAPATRASSTASCWPRS